MLTHDRDTIKGPQIAVCRPFVSPLRQVMPLKPPLWERIVDAFLTPFRFLSSLSAWIEWAVDRIITVAFSILSDLSVWFVWAVERTLLAPVRALSRLGVWINRTLVPTIQIDEGFKPLWQHALLFAYNLATSPVYFIWRIFSSPFRRRID